MDKCEQCKYYEGNYCHRYPQLQRKNADDFCGEFKEKVAGEQTKKE